MTVENMTTRSRAKKQSGVDPGGPSSNDDAATELTARVQSLEANLSVTEEIRSATEAELRQSMTEMKFEMQQLRDRYHKLLADQREQLEACHELQIQNVANTTTLSSLERNMDRFVQVLRAGNNPAGSSVPSEQRSVASKKHQDVDACSESSCTSFRAESRLTELSECRSMVSEPTYAQPKSAMRERPRYGQ